MKKIGFLLFFNTLLFSNSLDLIDDVIKVANGKKIVTSIEKSNKILKVTKISKVK
jgi:hypothetical protein